MKALLFAVLLLIGGCATPIASRSPSEVSSGVEVKDTKFDARVTFTGPEVFEAKSRGLLTDHQRYRLRAWKERASGSTTYQLYANIWYNTGGWRYYRSASFDDGRQTDIIEIDRDVDCTSRGGYTSCSYEETIGVPITQEFLDSTTATGFSVRLNSKGGTESFITVPPNYIQGFLQVVSR
jgi:hypothetical protein